MKNLFFKENVYEILDYLEYAIPIIDSEGKIVYYNKSGQNLDDIDRDKAIGRHILEIYPSLTYDTSTLLEVIKTGETILNKEQKILVI